MLFSCSSVIEIQNCSQPVQNSRKSTKQHVVLQREHGTQIAHSMVVIWPLFSLVFPASDCPNAAAAKSLQSCPTLCDPIDGSPPGSPVPGILQARTLEWVAISFSNAWKWKVKVKSLSPYSFRSCLSLGYLTVPCLSSQNSIICLTNLCIKTWNAFRFLTRP